MYLPPSAAMTGEVILFWDKLFDSFNRKENGELTSVISSSSNHLSFWNNAVNRIRKMDFVESATHKAIRHNSKCLKNWIWTIQGAHYLWNILQTCGFSSFNLRFLNQDLVENSFSQIRDHEHRNNNPTPYQFGSSFKMLLTTNLTSRHSISANCKEMNEGTSLSLIQVISATESNENEDEGIEYAESAIPAVTEHNIFVAADNILKNILMSKTVIQCEQCVQNLENQDILKSIDSALQIAEVRFVDFCYTLEVKKKLKSILYSEVFSKVSTHCTILLDHLIEETVEQFIIQWCKYINKILNRKYTGNFENNYIYNEAKKMSIKYMKKKIKNVRKKSIKNIDFVIIQLIDIRLFVGRL